MLEGIRSNPLLSARRAAFTYSLAFLTLLSDMWFIYHLGIGMPEELLTETLVHGTGLYLGYTIFASFDSSW